MRLTETQFKRISHCLPRQRGNVSITNLQVLNAILYVAEQGCKWRGLPKEFGNWHTIYTRMNRWSKNGVLDRVFTELQKAQIIQVTMNVLSLELVFTIGIWQNERMREYSKREQSYRSDLTDAQWVEIAPLFSGLREYTWPKRELMDAVLYFVKTGCQWRHLPHDFPPYSTVHSFYRRARISGLWDKILQHLVIKTREDAGRKPEPSYAIIDSKASKPWVQARNVALTEGKKRKDENGTSW
jgi:transposase